MEPRAYTRQCVSMHVFTGCTAMPSCTGWQGTFCSPGHMFDTHDKAQLHTLFHCD